MIVFNLKQARIFRITYNANTGILIKKIIIMNCFNCFRPNDISFSDLSNDRYGEHNGTLVNKVDRQSRQFNTTAGHSKDFVALSSRYISKVCKTTEYIAYKERESNGLDCLIPWALVKQDRNNFLLPVERERLNTISSSTKNPVVVIENLRNGFDPDKLFELDIKVGFKSASKRELSKRGHPHPISKRELHRALDVAYGSSSKGWRIEGITVDGKKISKSKLRIALSADDQLKRFFTSLPVSKQKIILARVEHIRNKLAHISNDFIGSSILIVTDSKENTGCNVHLIDFAHTYPKKTKDSCSDVAIATSRLYEKLNAFWKNQTPL